MGAVRKKIRLLPADRPVWTPGDVARLARCSRQAVTYHCRQLERRGQLRKTGGLWLLSREVASLVVHEVEQSAQLQPGKADGRGGSGRIL